MKQDPDEFKMGYLFDHDHTMKILMLAAGHNVTPTQMIYDMIDYEWSLLERLLT